MEQNINTDFLEAMRKMTSTVSVVASKKDDTRYAMTATSVVSLTLEPPSMLICINKKASIHSILSEKVAINLEKMTDLKEMIGVIKMIFLMRLIRYPPYFVSVNKL